MLTDQEVSDVLFGNNVGTQQVKPKGQQPSQGMSDEEVASVLFSDSQKTEGSIKSFDIGANSDETNSNRELPFLDLAQLAFKSESGKVGFLKEKYKFVNQDPKTGNISAGDSPDKLVSYDPAGIENGYLGFMANAVSMIPEIAGQIMGATGGTALAPGVGTIAGGGTGSLLGTAVKQGIGDLLPGGKATAEERATDQILSGLFGAGGEGLGIALKGAGKYLIKPQMTRLLDKGVQADVEGGKVLKTMAKTFKFLASVDEKDTVDAGIYGFNRVLTPKYTDPRYVTNITKEIVDGVIERNSAVGNNVGIGDKWAISKFGNESVELRDIGSKLLEDLSLGRIGFINPVSNTIDESAFSSASDLKAFKNIASEFFSTNPRTGQLLPKNSTFENLLETRKRMDQFLDNYSKSENGNVYAHNAISDFVSGVRNKLAQTTVPKGVNMELPGVAEKVLNTNKYLKANKELSSWKSDLELLKNNGLNISDMKVLRNSIRNGEVLNSNIETFVKRLQDKTFSTSDTFKNIVEQLPKRYAGGGIKGSEGTIFDEIRKFNAAQGFYGSNPNLLRFGSIASYAGMFGVGFADSKQDKAASLVGGLLLGTPAGASALLKGGEKLFKFSPKQAFKQASKGVNFKSERVSIALLSSLFRQIEKESSSKPK